MTRICIVPRVEGSGGMASFRLKFEEGLGRRGIQVDHDPGRGAAAVLLIAGTRDLWSLQRARKRGVRIVQRLDGINWVQRARWAGLRYHLRAEYGNALLSFIRSRFADRVIYQSRFIREWWEAWYGVAKAPSRVIHNGVDLGTYTPDGAHERPSDRRRMLVLEGSLAGGLNAGLFQAVSLAERLSKKMPMEVTVAGRVDPASRTKIERESRVRVDFLGLIPRGQVPHLARSSHLLFSAEVNPPCPNSVIEALACGLPVVGFDTGSLRELVGAEAGRIVPYGGDPWKLEKPDLPSLAEAAEEVLQDQARFRRTARERAVAEFGLDKMVESYLNVLLED
jgi:glycosyltransferase involved in cell wall biosynthesis